MDPLLFCLTTLFTVATQRVAVSASQSLPRRTLRTTTRVLSSLRVPVTMTAASILPFIIHVPSRWQSTINTFCSTLAGSAVVHWDSGVWQMSGPCDPEPWSCAYGSS